MFIAVNKTDASICMSAETKEEILKRMNAHGGPQEFSVFRLDGTKVDLESGYLAPRLHFYPSEERNKLFPQKNSIFLWGEAKTGKTQMAEPVKNPEDHTIGDDPKNAPWNALLPKELRYWEGVLNSGGLALSTRKSAILPRDSVARHRNDMIETPLFPALIPRTLNRFRDIYTPGEIPTSLYSGQAYTIKDDSEFFRVRGTIGEHLLVLDKTTFSSLNRVLNITRRSYNGKEVYGYTYLFYSTREVAEKLFSQLPAPAVWFPSTGMSELINKITHESYKY